MARPVIPNGRKLLIVLALAGIGFAAMAWWQRPPPEPVVRGRGLSEYMGYPPDTDDPRPVGEQIAAYGPAGVRWLAYRFEHGHHPGKGTGPGLFAHAPEWLRNWVPYGWGGWSDWAEHDERIASGNMLSYFGAVAEPALPVLARALESGDDEMVGSAAFSLQSIGSIANPIVEKGLSQGSVRVRRHLIWQMCRREGSGTDAPTPRMIDAVIEALHDPDDEVRAEAISAIGYCVRKQYEATQQIDPRFDAVLPELVQFLSENDPRFVGRTLSTLGCFGEKAAPAIPRMIEIVDEEEQRLRTSGGDAQGELKNAARDAIYEFTSLKAVAAIPCLVRCLDSANWSLKGDAAEALQRMGSESWPAIEKILDEGSPRARSAILEKMSERVERDGEIASEAEITRVAAVLEKALRDPSAEVRKAAVSGLEGCRGEREDNGHYDAAIPLLLGLLSDPDRDVVNSAAWACRAFGTKAAAGTPRLIELLDSEKDSGTPFNAVQSLATVDRVEQRSAARLRAMLPDADELLHKAIEEALAAFDLASGGKSTAGGDSPGR